MLVTKTIKIDIALYSALLCNSRGPTVEQATVRSPLRARASPRLKVIASNRPDAHGVVVLRARNQQPLPVVQLERFEGAVRRIHEPQMPTPSRA